MTRLILSNEVVVLSRCDSIVRMQQNQTEWITVGVQFQIMDYAQMNQLLCVCLLGEDSILQMGYTNDMFTPSFFTVDISKVKIRKGSADADSDPTTADQGIYELKRTIMQNFGGLRFHTEWCFQYGTWGLDMISR